MQHQRYRRKWVLVLLATFALYSESPFAIASAVIVTDVQRVQVTHLTQVDVLPPSAMVRVFHAMPVTPSWLPTGSDFLNQVSASPEQVVTQESAKGDGKYWRWEGRVPPGQRTFVTKFVVTTAHRELSPDFTITWDQIAAGASTLPESQRPLAMEVPDELIRVVRQIANTNDPLKSIQAFSTWIRLHIAYATTGIGYKWNDLPAILRGRKGWCGHRATVFLGMCAAAGIPAHVDVGFFVSDGKGVFDVFGYEDLHRHTWAEVFLGSAGWVEVEPAATNSAFAIPASYIKNPRDLQSEAIWTCPNIGAEWTIYSRFRDTLEFVTLNANPPAGDKGASVVRSQSETQPSAPTIFIGFGEPPGNGSIIEADFNGSELGKITLPAVPSALASASLPSVKQHSPNNLISARNGLMVAEAGWTHDQRSQPSVVWIDTHGTIFPVFRRSELPSPASLAVGAKTSELLIGDDKLRILEMTSLDNLKKKPEVIQRLKPSNSVSWDVTLALCGDSKIAYSTGISEGDGLQNGNGFLYRFGVHSKEIGPPVLTDNCELAADPNSNRWAAALVDRLVIFDGDAQSFSVSFPEDRRAHGGIAFARDGSVVIVLEAKGMSHAKNSEIYQLDLSSKSLRMLFKWTKSRISSIACGPRLHWAQ